jgi:hypothetical protein
VSYLAVMTQRRLNIYWLDLYFVTIFELYFIRWCDKP